jgi:hypothetical protein
MDRSPEKRRTEFVSWPIAADACAPYTIAGCGSYRLTTVPGDAEISSTRRRFAQVLKDDEGCSRIPFLMPVVLERASDGACGPPSALVAL